MMRRKRHASRGILYAAFETFHRMVIITREGESDVMREGGRELEGRWRDAEESLRVM